VRKLRGTIASRNSSSPDEERIRGRSSPRSRRRHDGRDRASTLPCRRAGAAAVQAVAATHGGPEAGDESQSSSFPGGCTSRCAYRRMVNGCCGAARVASTAGWLSGASVPLPIGARAPFPTHPRKITEPG
jgi:hypothetical protein